MLYFLLVFIYFCVLKRVNDADPESDSSNALVPVPEESFTPSTAVVPVHQRKALSLPKPKWHAPWKLYRVISGHLGWVRCVAVEPGNEWFATGSADRVIKVSTQLTYETITTSHEVYITLLTGAFFVDIF